MAASAETNWLVATRLTWAFAARGVCHVVVSPGSRSTPLVLAMEACPRLTLHVVLDERSAGFFALGLARATAQAVALLCTSGSAAANYLPAIVEADQSRVPLIVITADRPPYLHHCGAPQTMRQDDLYGSHVRCALTLPEFSRSPEAMLPGLGTIASRLVDAAMGSRPGPAHLNVPFAEPLWQPVQAHDDAVCDSPPPQVLRGAPRLDLGDVVALVARLRRSERGVIVCGPRAPAPAAGPTDPFAVAVCALAQRLGWPVIADPASQLRFGAHAHSHVVTLGEWILRDPKAASSLRPDCVLRFGQPPTAKHVAAWLASTAVGKTLLVEPGGEFLDPAQGLESLLVAEPIALCASLCEQLKGFAKAEQNAGASWLPVWQRMQRAGMRALQGRGDDGMWEGSVVRSVVESLPRGAALHVANSLAVRALDNLGCVGEARLPVFVSRGVNGIDGTLATALGEAKGWSHGPMVLVCGDLAFLHDIGSLRLGPMLGVDLMVVVMNNGGGGIFDHLAIAGHTRVFERFFSTPQEADIGKLAAANGAAFVRAASLEDLRIWTQEQKRSKGIAVIEVPIDRQHSKKAFAGCAQTVAAAIWENDS